MITNARNEDANAHGPEKSLSLWKNRNFVLLWTAGIITWLGNWMLVVALPTYVYHLTGSALATGTTFIVQTLPGLLFGSVAGVLVDRWDRRRTVIMADLARTVVFLPILLVHSAHNLWLIYAAVLVEAVIAQFFNPAQSALLPHVVAKEQLAEANARNGIGFGLALLIGPIIGGILYTVFGFSAVLLIDCASFLVSGLLSAFTNIDGDVERSEEDALDDKLSSSGIWVAIWRDLGNGLRVVIHEPLIRGLFLAIGLGQCALGIYYVLFIIWVTNVLHASAEAYGWLLGAGAAGGLLASVIYSRLTRGRAVPSPYLIALCNGLGGIAFFGVINMPVFPIALTLMVVEALGTVIFELSTTTLLQQAVADRYRGRVFGVLGTTNSLMLLIGHGSAALLGDKLGASTMLDGVSILYILAGVTLLLVSRNKQRSL